MNGPPSLDVYSDGDIVKRILVLTATVLVLMCSLPASAGDPGSREGLRIEGLPEHALWGEPLDFEVVWDSSEENGNAAVSVAGVTTEEITCEVTERGRMTCRVQIPENFEYDSAVISAALGEEKAEATLRVVDPFGIDPTGPVLLTGNTQKASVNVLNRTSRTVTVAILLYNPWRSQPEPVLKTIAARESVSAEYLTPVPLGVAPGEYEYTIEVREKGRRPAQVFGKWIRTMDWRVLGPFPLDGGPGVGERLDPGEDINLEKEVAGRQWKALDKTAYTRPAEDQELPRAYVDLLHSIEPNENVFAYAYTRVYALKEGTYEIQAASDDGLTIWINGEKVYSKEKVGKPTAGEHTARIELDEGRNDILLKITQHDGGWGFCFDVSPIGTHDAPLWFGIEPPPTSDADESQPAGED